MDLVLSQLEKTAVDAGVKDRDLQLWKTWKANDMHPDHMKPLLSSFKSMIHQEVRRWATSEIDLPTPVLKNVVEGHFVNALKSYDPDKGAALGTWVQRYLGKTGRFAATYRNTARMSEPRFYAKGKFDQAKSILTYQYGREPNTQEVADYMKLPTSQIANFEKESRGAHYASRYEDNAGTMVPSAESDVLNLLKYDLDPQELSVWEYTYGLNGKPAMGPGEIAKQLNLHPSKISRLRNGISAKIDTYLKNK